MPQAFIRKTASALGTAAIKIGNYDVPAGGSAVVMGLLLANVSNADITVSATLYDGAADVYLVKNARLPAGCSLPLDAKINLQAGDSIRAMSSAPSSLDAVLSLLERS